MKDRSSRLSRLAGRLAVLALFVAGCGIFDLRDPEEPAGSEVEYKVPVYPYMALRNLELAAEARYAGNFERACTEDYTFRFFDLDAISDSTWDLNRDIQALTTLFQAAPEQVDLTWTVTDSVPGGEDFYYGNLGYRLAFARGEADTVLVGGKCFLYLRNDGTQWLIYRWADIDDGTAEKTWGYARLHAAQIFSLK
jgi:hypothetical protein